MSTPANLQVWHWRFATPITGAAHEAWTLVGTEDTSYEGVLDTNYAIVFKLANDGDMADNDDYQLQYDINASGTWNNVNATSSFVRSAASGDTDDATSTTQRLTSVAGVTFDSSNLDEVDGIQTQNVGGSDAHEFYFTFNTRSAELSGGDSITFRLATTPVGTIIPEDVSLSTTPTMTMPIVAPIISTPTQTSIGQTTATVGFTTNTTSGTGYYYISTSATPPSATDLKAGTGAVDSGSSTVAASPHTFNASGLTHSTNYYTHFIHNSDGDSNILTSTQWTTAIPATGATTFTNNLSEAITRVITTAESTTLASDLSEAITRVITTAESTTLASELSELFDTYITKNGSVSITNNLSETLTNLLTALTDTSLSNNLSEQLTNTLTGVSDATFTNNLSETLNNILIANKSASFGINLSTTQTTSLSITGNMTLGVNFAKTTSTVASRVAAFNADITISESSVAARLLSSAVSYSLTLDYDTDTLGAGILDDPVWSISSSEYIFVDLTNIALIAGTIKSGTITLTSQMGHTTTVNLVGEAATNILLNLSQVQEATADRSVSATLSKQLSATSSAVADMFKSITFAIDLDKLSDAYIAKLASLILALELSTSQTNLMQGYENITLGQNLSDVMSTLATRKGDLTLSTDLSKDSLNSLIKPLTIDFDITVDLLSDIQADLNAAITYLMNLSEIFEGTTQGVVPGAVTFTTNLAKTEQVQAILNPIASFILNVGDTELAKKITSEAITYLLQVQHDVEGSTNILGILNLAINVSDEEVAQKGVFAYVDYIVDLSESINVKADYIETLTLLINLSQVSTSLKNVNGLTNLDISLSTNQINQLYKIATIALISNLSVTQTNKADLGVTLELATALTDFLLGESTGNLSAFATLATNVSHESLNLKQTFESISFESLLDQLSTGSKQFLATAELDLTLEDLSTVSLTREGIVDFNTIFTKLTGNTIVGRPTMSIDMTLADLSSTQKQTLSQILLGMQSETSFIGAKEVAGLVLYGLNNGLDTSVNLTAEGQVTFTTNLLKTGIVQLLGQAGITFGQLVGLASLGGALRDANINVGIITDVSTSGFVIQFTLITPEGRILKVYLEDRITIVDEENRVIKVWDRHGVTIN